jgi:membrane protein YdbS with pleckstrin-like domain
MDVMIEKKTKTKKLKYITSFLIIAISIILLTYAIINDEPMVILVSLILIIKIFDIALNIHKIRRRSYRHNIKH